jgi:hypothetical protein
VDIAGWLRELGLEQYEPAFRENDVDGDVLRSLTVEDLRDLGIISVGHRRRLFEAIKTLPADIVPTFAAAKAQTRANRRELTVTRPVRPGFPSRLDLEDLREIPCGGALCASPSRLPLRASHLLCEFGA